MRFFTNHSAVAAATDTMPFGGWGSTRATFRQRPDDGPGNTSLSL